MHQPDIAVIIPCHNAATFLDETFESIRRQTVIASRTKQREAVEKQGGEEEKFGGEKAQKLGDNSDGSDSSRLLVSTASGGSLSVLDAGLLVEVCVYDDASTDATPEILRTWKGRFQEIGVQMHIGGPNTTKSSGSTEKGVREKGSSSRGGATSEQYVQPKIKSEPLGVGGAKNAAVALSSAPFLCFHDADDLMEPSRLQIQYDTACSLRNFIVGSRFRREPADSTERYAKWLNELSPEQLYTQRWRECTLLMPTWFLHRSVFERQGGFEDGKGAGRLCCTAEELQRSCRGDATSSSSSSSLFEFRGGIPEDLLFLYRHLRAGGGLMRVDEALLVYRYHAQCASFRVDWRDIWDVRFREFERDVLDKWTDFGVWNAGKEGRHFLRSLSEKNRNKVRCFYDVDKKKVEGMKFYVDSQDPLKRKVPIKHWTEAKPKFVTCVKYMITGGTFEEYLASLNLKEGIDFFYFS